MPVRSLQDQDVAGAAGPQSSSRLEDFWCSTPACTLASTDFYHDSPCLHAIPSPMSTGSCGCKKLPSTAWDCSSTHSVARPNRKLSSVCTLSPVGKSSIENPGGHNQLCRLNSLPWHLAAGQPTSRCAHEPVDCVCNGMLPQPGSRRGHPCTQLWAVPQQDSSTAHASSPLNQARHVRRVGTELSCIGHPDIQVCGPQSLRISTCSAPTGQFQIAA